MLLSNAPTFRLLTLSSFSHPSVLLYASPLRSRLKVDTLGSLDDRSVGDTGEGELRSKLHDVLFELGDQFGRFSRSRLESLGEVFEEFGSGLFLSGKGDLNDSVEELCDLLDVLLDHGSGSQSGSSDSDTSGDKGGS